MWLTITLVILSLSAAPACSKLSMFLLRDTLNWIEDAEFAKWKENDFQAHAIIGTVIALVWSGIAFVGCESFVWPIAGVLLAGLVPTVLLGLVYLLTKAYELLWNQLDELYLALKPNRKYSVSCSEDNDFEGHFFGATIYYNAKGLPVQVVARVPTYAGWVTMPWGSATIYYTRNRDGSWCGPDSFAGRLVDVRQTPEGAIRLQFDRSVRVFEEGKSYRRIFE